LRACQRKKRNLFTSVATNARQTKRKRQNPLRSRAKMDYDKDELGFKKSGFMHEFFQGFSKPPKNPEKQKKKKRSKDAFLVYDIYENPREKPWKTKPEKS
jgi:hypothetical protein